MYFWEMCSFVRYATLPLQIDTSESSSSENGASRKRSSRKRSTETDGRGSLHGEYIVHVKNNVHVNNN